MPCSSYTGCAPLSSKSRQAGDQRRPHSPYGELMKVVRARVDVDKEGKGIYRDIGRIVETKKHGPMLKLNVIPVGWDGWGHINEAEPKTEYE